MSSTRKTTILTSIIFLLLSSLSFADIETASTKPLWETGMFGSVIRLPYYRGSDEYKTYAFPLPYFVYRGEIIKSDRDGIRGIFYGNEHLESSLSFFGNPPVDSDSKAREGMPDLDAILEVGPALKWIFNGKDALDPLYLKLAVRAAISIGFDDGVDMGYEGLHYNVALNYRNYSLFCESDLNFSLAVGVDFADSSFNQYIYDVEDKYATDTRRAYHANAGFAGSYLSSSLEKKLLPYLSFGAYFRWENVYGAAFESSPLVREKNNFIAGCALVLKIAESFKMVHAVDIP